MGFLSNILGSNNNYTAQQPKIGQQDFGSLISPITAQQSALTQTLLNQANGQGPNPAAIALQQATANNIKQQAGATASVAGISPALAARINAQNGAAVNQTAAGQGALQEAQQQLSAEQLASNSLNTQENILQGANAAQNNTITAGTNAANQVNAGVAAGNASTNGSIAGGLLGGAGSLLSATGALGSGAQKAQTSGNLFADGGPVSPTPPSPPAANPAVMDMFHHAFGKAHGGAIPSFLRGGAVPVKVSPGERYIPPQQVKEVNEGKKSPVKVGHKIPGKAVVKGDSPKNDIVPGNADPGAVVIPRSIENAPDKAEKAKKFMEEIAGKKKPEGFAGVLKAKKHLESAHASLLAAHKAMGKK